MLLAGPGCGAPASRSAGGSAGGSGSVLPTIARTSCCDPLNREPSLAPGSPQSAPPIHFLEPLVLRFYARLLRCGFLVAVSNELLWPAIVLCRVDLPTADTAPSPQRHLAFLPARPVGSCRQSTGSAAWRLSLSSSSNGHCFLSFARMLPARKRDAA